ncbi:LamG domain-containing protein [Vineibacter terrae]|uniref:LamG domain-containing protein n=1 Tax=Vineibacter terrae TaxID=2586908 RepID=A0A5C8PNA5_9HYPH|nr:N,N-dimethylformamidase beta subunit family domain-containing protein [Vineibacter terrae]TXL75366.1 LamG domain-containing protein [Vineibacter terrae]
MRLGGIDTTSILGYAAPLAVEPGGQVAFHLSSDSLQKVDVTVVRVRCGDPDPAGPGLKLVPMASPVNGPRAVSHQPIRTGSCAVIADRPALRDLASFTVGCFLWPTLPGTAAQTILSRWRDDRQAGWRLGLDASGHLELAVGDGTGAVASARSARPVLAREWLFVCGSYDAATGQLAVHQISLDPQAGRDRSSHGLAKGGAGLAWPQDVPLVIAARCTGEALDAPRTAAHFDGKIDRPRLCRATLEPGAMRAQCERINPAPGDPDLLAAWDFSIDIPGLTVQDRSAHRLHGRLVQVPARGVTGANWDGTANDWRALPAHYGAIHFCADDMADCGWSADFTLDVPTDWPAGYYAVRLAATPADGDPVESYVGFFVRSPRARPAAKLAIVVPIATYLAYANGALRMDQVHAESMLEGLMVLSRDDLYLQAHREVGLSTYDTHADGSGWRVSGSRRPILNMRPRCNTFNYGNDTHLIDWLEEKGIDYDVVTDEDLHREGLAALRPYRCVMTLSHPEYYSREMWDALDSYQRAGGRHMYLGGNGFYWRIAFHRDLANVIEVRRDVTGVRTWEGEAGEAHLAFTGEAGGLWRSNGRAPQRLVGVGFDAQVFDRSAGYRRLPASHDPRAAWMFEGIGADEMIGNFGARNGGAAGLEIDRADPSLGSPPGMLLVASADRIGYGGMPAPEEFRTFHRGLDGEQNARVRADLVYFPTAQGGGVFSTGSIAWVTALSHNRYDNNVSRLMENVVRRFLDPAPLP